MPSDPSITGLLNLLGQGASAAYDYLIPDYYQRDGGAYSPAQWADWYAKSSQYGTPEFAQYQDYLAVAQPRLDIRLREYLEHLRSQPQQDEEGNPTDAALTFKSLQGPLGRNARAAIIGGRLPAEPQQILHARRESEKFFDWLIGTSISGDDRPDTSVTPELMEEWKKDPDWRKAWRSNWRMTPAGQEAFAKLLDYNLLNAFQQGKHQPAPLSTAAISGIGGALGSAYERMTYGPQYGVPGSRIGAAQTNLLSSPSPAKAMQYATEVARFAETQDPEYFYSWVGGSPIPQFSLMTGEGVAQQSSSGMTFYGQIARPMTAPFLMPHFNRQERGDLSTTMNQIDRFTPVVPEGMYEQAADLRERGTTLENDNWKQISAYLPKWIRDFNGTFAASPAAWGGELPPAPPGQKYEAGPAGYPQLAELSEYEKQYQDWRREQGLGQQEFAKSGQNHWANPGITPFHSTAAFNDTLMVAPAILGDPGNAAMAAIAGLGALATTGSFVKALKSSLAAGVSDMPSENLYNTALSLTYSPQTIAGYYTEPDPGNPVRDASGNIPPADSDRYMDALQSWEQGRDKTLTDFGQYQNELRRRQAKPNNQGNASDPILGKPFMGVR